MTDLMYEIPSDESIRKCIITKDTVENGAEPVLIRKNDQPELVETAEKKEKKEA